MNSTTERWQKHHGMTGAHASRHRNSIMTSRSASLLPPMCWPGLEGSEGGKLCVPITKFLAPRDQLGGVGSACLQHHRQNGTLRTCTCPGTMPTPHSPSEVTDSSRCGHGSWDVALFNPPVAQVRKRRRKTAPDGVSRASDHKLDNHQFTAKQFSKAKRYLEKYFSKYTILISMFILLLLKMIRDASTLNDLQQMKVQLWCHIHSHLLPWL